MTSTAKLQFTRLLTASLIIVLFIGTLMPGRWKQSAEQTVDVSINLAGVAHVVLFAAICWLLPRTEWWRIRSWHVLAVGAVLAFVTEGLQFFAIDRHPNLAGVAQNLTGTLIGWALGRSAARNL